MNQNLTPNCKPIASKSRNYSAEDTQFIRKEIQHLLEDDIIEPRYSTWHTQIVVTSTPNKKKRLVVNFSHTINCFILLDVYPLPRIEDLVNQIGQYRIFSIIDLSKAYYQIEICPKDRPYMVFQAGNRLYQFKRIPMGVTNGVSAFQRFMNSFISDDKLSGTFSYLDDITVCDKTQEEHDVNLEGFLKAASTYNFETNREKSKFSLRSINILGYKICDGTLRPDPEHLRPLLQMPPPSDSKSLKRCLGMFAYHTKLFSLQLWVNSRTDKVLQPWWGN